VDWGCLAQKCLCSHEASGKFGLSQQMAGDTEFANITGSQTASSAAPSCYLGKTNGCALSVRYQANESRAVSCTCGGTWQKRKTSCWSAGRKRALRNLLYMNFNEAQHDGGTCPFHNIAILDCLGYGLAPKRCWIQSF